jgi:hypothetical protein
MPKLVHVSTDTGGRTLLIGVDEEGDVWRGQLQNDREGSEYIAWKHIRSEFERDRP